MFAWGPDINAPDRDRRLPHTYVILQIFALLADGALLITNPSISPMRPKIPCIARCMPKLRLSLSGLKDVA